MKNRLHLLTTMILSVFLCSCGAGGDNSSSTKDDSTGAGNEPSNQVEPSNNSTKLDFSGVSFNSATYVYDGQPHILTEVSGAPENTTITYTGRNEYTNVGTYAASAKLVKDGYNDKTLDATLTISPATISGITFVSQTITYDGNPHTLQISGDLPEGGSVSYTNNGPHINAGEYHSTATISAPNYNDLTLNAALTISKASITGIAFENGEFEYDGSPHSIAISGTLPSSANVTYTSDVEGVTNTATDIGVYNITATITDDNFDTLVLHAKLTIKTNDDERYIKWSNDTLFFQNALHDNYLYAYNNTSGNLLKVSKDNAVDIIESSNDQVLFVSKSLLSSSIKKAEYNSLSSEVNLTTIHTANARYVQYGDSDTVYYVVNGLTQNKSGIYKADLSGDESVVTRLSVGKAKYLTLVGDKLYFADGNNDYKLSSISIIGTDQSRSLIVDEKIKNLSYDNGAFYYTVDRLLGNYIEKYTVSNGRRKLTSDAGIDFCVIGGYLYYINVDKLNTAIFGDGIYKVNASPLSDNNNPGTKVAESESGICSLTSDGTYLYYYDMDGYKLVKSDTNGNLIADLLDGFVKPADPTPTSLGGDVEEYNGKIYYLDVWDDKTLHSYNPQTHANVKLTSNKVDNFSIIGDNIYLNMVTKLVNNDTYRFNLTTGSEPEKINTNDGNDFVCDGTYLYYAQDNGAGVKTAIRRTNLTTFDDEEIYDKGVSNLRIVNGKLCFIDGYQIFSMNLDTLETTEIKPENKSVHTTAFDTDGTTIFYREMYSVGYALKRLSRYNPQTNEYAKMAQDNTDPVNIVYYDGFVYYYTDTTSAANNGLYKVSADTSSTNQGTCVLACNSTYYATTFTFASNKIYFLNYISGGLFGDSHMYEVPINGGTPEKIA